MPGVRALLLFVLLIYVVPLLVATRKFVPGLPDSASTMTDAARTWLRVIVKNINAAPIRIRVRK